MRKIPTLAFLAALLAASAAWAADACSPPKILNAIQMRQALSGSDLIPVGINGVEKLFLFDTGGGVTQVARNTALDLALPRRRGDILIYDLAGNISRDQASVGAFTFGNMSNRNMVLPISPAAPFEGIFAPDLLLPYDVDVDFGTDMLTFLSRGGCPGGAAAEAPIILEGTHIMIPVTLDGQQLDAVIDTGASRSDLRIDVAQRLFMLPLGDADTPENGVLNGVPSLKTYRHVFGRLTFGSVTIVNPRLILIPDVMVQQAQYGVPKMILGMDVLRKLRIHIAFRGSKIYVSPASPPAAPASSDLH